MLHIKKLKITSFNFWKMQIKETDFIKIVKKLLWIYDKNKNIQNFILSFLALPVHPRCSMMFFWAVSWRRLLGALVVGHVSWPVPWINQRKLSVSLISSLAPTVLNAGRVLVLNKLNGGLVSYWSQMTGALVPLGIQLTKLLVVHSWRPGPSVAD